MRAIYIACLIILSIWLATSLYKLKPMWDIFGLSILICTTAWWAFNPNCTEHPLYTLATRIANFITGKSHDAN